MMSQPVGSRFFPRVKTLELDKSAVNHWLTVYMLPPELLLDSFFSVCFYFGVRRANVHVRLG